MTNLYSLPKEMLIKIITTMQSTSLDLQPYLDWANQYKNDELPKICPHIFTGGPNFRQKCGRENCGIHFRRNKLSLIDIKFLFEKYPHYFFNVIDIISFISTYHSNNRCPGCPDCLDDDIYNERVRSYVENLYVTLPMSHE